MPGAFADRIMESSTSTGAGDFTLAGVVSGGYNTFDSMWGSDFTIQFYYCIEDVDANGVPDGEWEVGVGHLSSSTTLVRDYVLSNSDGDTDLIPFDAGPKQVFCPFPAHESQRVVNSLFDLQFGMP